MSKLIPPLTILVVTSLIALCSQETTVSYKTIFAEKEIQLTESVSYWRFIKLTLTGNLP